MEKKPTPAGTFGIILALISILLFLTYYFTGISFTDGALKWIPAAVSFALIIFVVIKWANDNNNNVTFGKCFGYGFKVVAISTIIIFIFTAIFIFTFPDYKEQFMESMRQQFNKNSDLSEEQAEQAVAMVEKFFTISILGGTLFGSLLVGTVAALIGAAVAKKNPQDPFAQPQM
ncbi:hypothetical protein BH10BAC2_BH10BAC2_46240 [soil metagenome]